MEDVEFEDVVGYSSVVEFSLDSVLQKATGLEDTLRKMTVSLGEEEGRGSPKGVDLVKAGKIAPREHESAPGPQEGSNGDIATQWQKLTSYIVALENELQYYKQLVEGYAEQASLLAQEEQAKLATSTDPIRPVHDPCVVEQSSCSSDNSGQDFAGCRLAVPRSSALTNLQQWDKMLQDDPVSRVLFLVFCLLSTDELCMVSRVCRKWHSVSKHPLLWRSITISEATIGSQTLSRMSSQCSHTEKLTLHGLMPTMAGCDEDLQTYINRTRGCLESGLTTMFSVGGQRLKSLSITECNLMLTNRVFWLASVYCPNLQRLTYCSDEFPPSAECLWSLANGCRNITSLTFPPIIASTDTNCFDDGCLSIIASSWPDLTSLSVGGTKITLNGISEIAQCCVKLCHLELLHGPPLNSSAMSELCRGEGLSSLQSLTLTFTPTSPRALQCLLVQRPNITSLEVHLSLHTYFPFSKEPTDISKYEKVITGMKKLQRQAEISKIFKLHEHYTVGLADKLI